MDTQKSWDKKEELLFRKLTTDWEKHTQPGIISKGLKKATAPVANLLPKKFSSDISKYMEEAMSWDVIKKVTTIAAKGFVEIGKSGCRYTLSPQSVVNAINGKPSTLCEFQRICELRSYDLEKCVMSNRIRKQISAAFEGGTTGFFGIFGVPFNITMSFLLYYRAVQHIALFYGYDVLNDPREMEIASEVLINSLSPSLDKAGAGVGSYMAKAMFCAEMSSLGRVLAGKKTFESMAKAGGAQLFYVQIRALAHKSAQKGLEKAGRKGMENFFLKKILEHFGRLLPKQSAAKAVPVVGALIGGAFDGYYMTRIHKGANLQYHKRFLIEKDERIHLLN